jgi:putative transposase
MRAGIVEEAWEYPWSSAAFHIGKVQEAGIIRSDKIRLIGDWKTYLREKDENGFVEPVRRESFVNRPLGDAAFINVLEEQFQLRLTRGKAGRPAKIKDVAK